MPRKLLQHKSYDVHKAENVARVRRDEQRAREQAEAELRRRKDQERAARTEALRSRASGHDTRPAEPNAQTQTLAPPIGTKERDSKPVTQKPGPLAPTDGVRLGGAAARKAPWYASIQSTTTTEKDITRKTSLDPLADMNAYVEKTRQHEDRLHREATQSQSRRSRRPSNTSQ